MCTGSPQPPKVVTRGPSNKEAKQQTKQQQKQLKQQERELKQVRKDSRVQAQEFRQQLQSQIDAAANQTQQFQQQIAEVMAPPINRVLANNYAVTTQQQELPATAQTTEVTPTMRQQPTSLRIMPGTTAINPGAGLNIGA